MIQDDVASFDLISNPDLIQPPYSFYAVFLLAGFVLAAIAAFNVLSKRRVVTRLSVFATAWITLTSGLTYLDARDVSDVRELVRKGQYSIVEGCVESFKPGSPYGSKTTAGFETWSVAGREFSYGQGQGMPFYHRVQPKGGIVHANSRVRVSYLVRPYYGDTVIVRLQVLAQQCSN